MLVLLYCQYICLLDSAPDCWLVLLYWIHVPIADVALWFVLFHYFYIILLESALIFDISHSIRSRLLVQLFGLLLLIINTSCSDCTCQLRGERQKVSAQPIAPPSERAPITACSSLKLGLSGFALFVCSGSVCWKAEPLQEAGQSP